MLASLFRSKQRSRRPRMTAQSKSRFRSRFARFESLEQRQLLSDWARTDAPSMALGGSYLAAVQPRHSHTTRRTLRMIQEVRLKWLNAIVVLALSAAAAQAATIETVPVGNPGNAADTRYETPGYGAVGYSYNIGKYEVTAGQYTEFLNAVAATDPYYLYNIGMWDAAYGCKIQRSGSSGSYTYSVAATANRPVSHVSPTDAARFSNWMTTGDTESGVYTFSSGTLQSIMDHQTAGATYGMAYFIASEDEWYKAAYYNGSTSTYYDYATGSDNKPDGIDFAGDAAFDAVFDDGYIDSHPNDVDNAGVFSPYGTMGQDGNVDEWCEPAIGSPFYFRGGSWLSGSSSLQATQRNSISFGGDWWDVGFRVASTASMVPEPSSVASLLSMGIVGLIGLWWRRRKAS